MFSKNRNKRNSNKRRFPNRKRFYKRKMNTLHPIINVRRDTMPDFIIKDFEVSELLQSIIPTINFEFDLTPSNPEAVFSGVSTITSTYFTQMMEYYNRYLVLASKIQIDYVNSVGTECSALWLAIVPTLTGGQFAGILDAQTNRRCKSNVVGSLNGVNIKRLSNYCSTMQIHGVNPNFDQDYSGIIGTAPAKNWFWAIVGTADNTGGVIRMLIKVWLKVKFYDRKNMLTTGVTPLFKQLHFKSTIEPSSINVPLKEEKEDSEISII